VAGGETGDAPLRALPRLEEAAPDFEALSTHGDIRLSDFRGRWVILFGHPADFTPVCTTEFVEFARHAADLEQRDVQLIAVSVDSIYSHIAWVRSMEAAFGVKITFPVVADLDMAVSELYGMVHKGASSTEPVRAVFVIDPDQVVRAIVYYPMSTGRSVIELIRLVDALQMHDATGAAIPAEWQPGDDVVEPVPMTVQEADRRTKTSPGAVDWYLSTRPASPAE
jgi:peroxiredoxin (alkyl hydroperoxide reductase subunit C)